MSLEQRLADRITSGDQVWVSLRDCGLPREQVDVVASRHDREVIWQCTDDTDQWMLIGEPDDLPIRATAPLVPYNLAVVLPWLALVRSVGVVVYLLSATDKSAVLPWGIAGLALSVNLALMPRRAAVPTRIARLAREFNGKAVVKIGVSRYWLSPFLIWQLAATYGYRYTGFAPNNLSATLVFVKTH